MRLLDVNILKLDTAIENTFQKLNKPSPGITVHRIIENLARYEGPKTIQTLFVRGINSLSDIDNTREAELEALIDTYRILQPDSIMVYTYERDTPTHDLEKIPTVELEKIGQRLQDAGFRVELTL